MRHHRETVGQKPWNATLARQVAAWISQPEACALVGGMMFIWAISSSSSRINPDWQLALGIGTILVTFVVALLIQNDPVAEGNQPTPGSGSRRNATGGWDRDLRSLSPGAVTIPVNLDSEGAIH